MSHQLTVQRATSLKCCGHEFNLNAHPINPATELLQVRSRLIHASTANIPAILLQSLTNYAISASFLSCRNYIVISDICFLQKYSLVMHAKLL